MKTWQAKSLWYISGYFGQGPTGSNPRIDKKQSVLFKAYCDVNWGLLGCIMPKGDRADQMQTNWFSKHTSLKHCLNQSPGRVSSYFQPSRNNLKTSESIFRFKAVHKEGKAHTNCSVLPWKRWGKHVERIEHSPYWTAYQNAVFLFFPVSTDVYSQKKNKRKKN